MTTKVCTKCGIEKDFEDFPLRSRITGRRQSYCKECVAQKSGRWYQNNKGHQKGLARNRTIVYRQNAKEYVWEYLTNHPCISCGETNPNVLEFHHVRGKKEHEISRMIGKAASLENLKAEIEKCVVLCANCHRKLTAKEQGWFRR
jgi:hypothetical protein